MSFVYCKIPFLSAGVNINRTNKPGLMPVQLNFISIHIILISNRLVKHYERNRKRGESFMEEKKNRTLILPEHLSIHSVIDLLEDMKKVPAGNGLTLDFSRVVDIDSFGLAYLNHVRKNHKHVHFVNLSQSIEHLLAKLSGSVHDSIAADEGEADFRSSISEYVRLKLLNFKVNSIKYLTLLVDELHYTFRYIIRKRGVLPGEISHQLFSMGYDSFPIVCLISFLVGVTISITSLGQLRQVGADIYLADLVGFGMIRELVPLMTGIILAGKIGASITAEISSMMVLEEVSALKTMAIIPEQYLMVPRLIAITLAVPLLVGMADMVGIMGGALVANLFSEVPPRIFFKQVFEIVDLGDFVIGLFKTLFFGWVVVVSAAYKGFTVGMGPEGVGMATTQSVVLSISSIIILDCIFALILY